MDIEVTRLSNDSIAIRVAGGDKLEEYQTGKPFTIMIGDSDASNTSAIVKSGLSLAITPGDGLMSGLNSSVVITGEDVTSMPYTVVVNSQTINRTDSTRVRVFGYHKSGARICLMDKAV
ncbi:hypothetical protein [Methanocella conradii]|uniref:hypothetical protein n=1 Tax=Methanocella conradii TaxID=1175444 RepID=UPI0024B34738|nr:hypothetical protein [Methanocella conradii]MDI6897107.1 hypothetical protein [Methanocella conradii]